MPKNAKRILRKLEEPTRQNKFLSLLAIGTRRMVACDQVGISWDTFRYELEKSPEFAEKVRESEASVMTRNLAVIERAAKEGDWKASAWMLERVYPDEFGRVDRMKLVGNDGNEPVIRISLNVSDPRTKTIEASVHEGTGAIEGRTQPAAYLEETA